MNEQNHKKFALFAVGTKILRVCWQEVRKNVVTLGSFCWKFMWLPDSSLIVKRVFECVEFFRTDAVDIDHPLSIWYF